MNVARIRKSLFAAGSAALGAFLLGLKTETPQTEEGWVALVTGALGIGIVAGLGTYRVRNDGTVNGSDPVTPATQTTAGRTDTTYRPGRYPSDG